MYKEQNRAYLYTIVEQIRQLLCEASPNKKLIFVFKVFSDYIITSILPYGPFPESIWWYEAGFKRDSIISIYS